MTSLGVAEQCHGEAQALLHALREVADPAPRCSTRLTTRRTRSISPDLPDLGSPASSWWSARISVGVSQEG